METKIKISYLSDIHIDMYVTDYNQNGFWVNTLDGKRHSSVNPIGIIVSKLLKNTKNIGDILIIAGDLGHKNEQNLKFLDIISEYFDHVYIVLGNHDYYLINSESYKYVHSSNLRVDELRTYIKDMNKVTLLEGQIVNYKGIKIQGNVGWADGQYLSKTLKSDKDPQELYIEGDYLGPGKGWVRMNDCVLIKPGHRFDARFKSNQISWEPGETDIMVTHYNPSILKSHQNPKYKNDYLTTFYCFDGSKLMKEKTPKLWFYGHSHEGVSYKYKGCQVLTNAIGYPHEPFSKLELKTVEYKKVQ